MYPYVFENLIGEWALVPTYGIFLALAFTTAYFESLRRALSVGENPKHIEQIFFIVVVSSLGGARLFHVLFEGFSYYRENPKEALAFWEGGFTFYGGLLACTASLYVYCRFRKLSYYRMLDLIAPPTLLGLFLGRIGCFAAGCCWGSATSLPWAVTYTHRHTLSQLQYVPTHPTQLYESLGCLLIFMYLRRLSKQNRIEGTIFLTALCAYACLRFVVEFTRGDSYRGFVFGGHLSIAQFLSLALLAITALALRVNISERIVSH